MGDITLDMLADEIVRRIRSVSEPERIIVFGSHARGDAGPDSDVDVLVVRQGLTQRREETFRYRQALRGLGVPFDIIVISADHLERFGDNPYTILPDALREGTVIYERVAA